MSRLCRSVRVKNSANEVNTHIEPFLLKAQCELNLANEMQKIKSKQLINLKLQKPEAANARRK